MYDVHCVHFGDVSFGAVAETAVVGVGTAVAEFAARGLWVDVGFADTHATPPLKQVAAALLGFAADKG